MIEKMCHSAYYEYCIGCLRDFGQSYQQHMRVIGTVAEWCQDKVADAIPISDYYYLSGGILPLCKAVAIKAALTPSLFNDTKSARFLTPPPAMIFIEVPWQISIKVI